jgi:hypothetical protein
MATSANERYLLRKLSLFQVAAFFIADVGNGLILSGSSEFEPNGLRWQFFGKTTKSKRSFP